MAYIRETFTKVVSQPHPRAPLSRFSSSEQAEPDEVDFAIAAELADIVSKGREFFGSSDGEWQYLDKYKRNTYLAAIRQPFIKTDELATLFRNMFRGDATYGLVTPSYTDLDQSTTTNQILCDLDTCFEFSSVEDLGVMLFDAELGNPFGLDFDGQVLAPDSPRHYYYAAKLASLMAKIGGKKKVLEIGGGYGGMALILKRIRPNVEYVIVDLFETCLVQYYFLRKAGVPVSFIMNASARIPSGHIALVPTQVADVRPAVLADSGVAFNSRSFSEMSRETVEHYFSLLQEFARPQYILHENSNFLLFPNSERHIEVLACDFPINRDQYHLANAGISPFLGGGGRYREFLYERVPT